jgi:hypothetical protein
MREQTSPETSHCRGVAYGLIEKIRRWHERKEFSATRHAQWRLGELLELVLAAIDDGESVRV